MLWARWAIAAVAMSPPQLSSIVVATPSETQRSRACRAFVKPPNLLILILPRPHGPVGVAAEQDVERVDVLVEHKRMIAMPSDREAFLVRAAGLFDVYVDIADGTRRAEIVDHRASRYSHPAISRSPGCSSRATHMIR